MSHETWDKIADSYIPLLVVIIFIDLFWQAIKNPNRRDIFAQFTLHFFIPCVGVYILKGLDQQLQLWPAFGWDYSTHTALSAVCCWHLWRRGDLFTAANSGSLPPSNWRYIWPVSLALYLILMSYQRYHTWSDMLSTLAAIGLLILLINKIPRLIKRLSKAEI